MGTLKYIAYVVSAVLFISIGFLIALEYNRSAAVQSFKIQSEGLAGRIWDMVNQSPGTVWYFNISVPENCMLSFSDSMVVINVGGWSDNFPTGVLVSGPSFTNQRLYLKLERTENEVRVSEQV